MSKQHQSAANRSGWSRFQSVAKFVKIIFGWGPLGFSVAVPFIATVILISGAIWSVITHQSSVMMAVEHFANTLSVFMTASSNSLLTIVTIGIISLGLGTAGIHIAAIKLDRPELTPVAS